MPDWKRRLFNWTTDDGRVIYSVNWGIKNGNSPDSQFMNTNIYTKVVNYNTNMNPKYRYRVRFAGNLTIGRAWFVLKNVTKYDEKEYVANIREDTNGLFSYTVRLKVKEKAPVEETTQPVSTKITSAYYPTSAKTTVSTKTSSNVSRNASYYRPTKKCGNEFRYSGLLAAILSVPFMWCCILLLHERKAIWRRKRKQYITCSIRQL